MRFDSTLLLAILIVLAVAFPLEVGDGRINAGVLLAGLMSGAILLPTISLRPILERSRIVIASLTFIAVAVLSFGIGQYPWFSAPHAPLMAQAGGLAVFILSAGLFLFVGHEVRSLADLQRLTWLFIGIGAFQVVMMTVPNSLREIRVSSVAVTNVSTVGCLFWVWLVAVCFSQALFNTDLSSKARGGILSVGIGALGWGLLVSFDWASGWLPPLIGLSVILLLRFPRSTVCGGLLLLAPVMILSADVWSSIMKNEGWSWTTRLGAWSVMLQLLENNPLLGYGPANYPNYTAFYSYFGYHFRFNSHNNYLDLLAQTGVVGTVAFMWFAAEAFGLTTRLYGRVPAGFSRAYVVGAIGGLIGSLASGMLADWVVPFAYNIGLPGFRSSLLFWFFLGGLLALKRIVSSECAPDPTRVRQGLRMLTTARALR